MVRPSESSLRITPTTPKSSSCNQFCSLRRRFEETQRWRTRAKILMTLARKDISIWTPANGLELAPRQPGSRPGRPTIICEVPSERHTYNEWLTHSVVHLFSGTGLHYLWVDHAFFAVSSEYSVEQSIAPARADSLKDAHKLQRAIEMTSGEARRGGTREVISDDIRHFVWIRDKGACLKCGSNGDLQFDHIIPHSLGGNSEPANLQLLCGSCNRKKARD